MTAGAWAAPFAAIAGCAAWACRDRIRTAILRARWAWACRKPPARSEGKLTRAEFCAFAGLVETWRHSGVDERSRT